MKLKILAITAAATVLANFTAQASLIVNGSFEDAPVSAGGWSVFKSITGWQAIGLGDGIEVQNGAAGKAYEGSKLVELDSNNNSAMQQAVHTVYGQVYNLSVAYSARPGQALNTTEVDVLFNNAVIGKLNLDGTGQGATLWHVYNFNVIGTGHDDLVGFAAVGNSDSLGGYIDDVQMSAVPEPSTVIAGALLALPFGVSTLRRLRKNRA